MADATALPDGTGTYYLPRPRLLLLLTSSGVLQLDPWLEPYKDALKTRYSYAQQWIKKIDELEGGLEKFSRVCFAPDDAIAVAYIPSRDTRSSDSM